MVGARSKFSGRTYCHASDLERPYSTQYPIWWQAYFWLSATPHPNGAVPQSCQFWRILIVAARNNGNEILLLVFYAQIWPHNLRGGHQCPTPNFWTPTNTCTWYDRATKLSKLTYVGKLFYGVHLAPNPGAGQGGGKRFCETDECWGAICLR